MFGYGLVYGGFIFGCKIFCDKVIGEFGGVEDNDIIGVFGYVLFWFLGGGWSLLEIVNWGF